MADKESPQRTATLEAFCAVLFQSGGRVKEVLALTKENFTILLDQKIIIVRGMQLEKRYRKLKELETPEGPRWQTEKIHAKRRDFPIMAAEPLTPILLQWLDQTKEGLLFPSPYKNNEPLTRSWAYKLIRKMDQAIPADLREQLGINKHYVVKGQEQRDKIHLWLHWFRSQRASQLVRDYRFEIIDLLKFFSWEKYETALHYAQKGWKDLAAKMQGPKIRYV